MGNPAPKKAHRLAPKPMVLPTRLVAVGVLGSALAATAYRVGARRLMARSRALSLRASSAIGSPLPRAEEHGSCIYLDYQATSPVWPEVADAAIPFLQLHWGNPSSGHAFGRSCAAAVKSARAAVAQLIGAKPDEIIFTGCGSEERFVKNFRLLVFCTQFTTASFWRANCGCGASWTSRSGGGPRRAQCRGRPCSTASGSHLTMSQRRSACRMAPHTALSTEG